MTEQLSLAERHHAAQLIHELCRPASAAVIAQLPRRPGASVEAEVARAGSALQPREFWTTVSRLVALQVINRDTAGLALARDQLDHLANGWVADSPIHAVIAAHPRVARFARWGRITGMPTDPDLLQEMYAMLAELFASGETLSEATVNARITAVHDDPADVRRALVDRGMLLRAPGTAIYQRPDST